MTKGSYVATARTQVPEHAEFFHLYVHYAATLEHIQTYQPGTNLLGGSVAKYEYYRRHD